MNKVSFIDWIRRRLADRHGLVKRRRRRRPAVMGTTLSRPTEPLWLFSVGSFGDSHPIVGGLIKKEPKKISEFEHRSERVRGAEGLGRLRTSASAACPTARH